MVQSNSNDFEGLIAWKIQQLQGENNHHLPANMETLLQENPQWQKELDFIEAFWQQEPIEKRPSADLHGRFYHMLSQAQAAQNIAGAGSTNKHHQSWRQKLTGWLTPAPMAQAAMLLACFSLGWTLKPDLATPTNVPQVAQLQQEISSLTAMMAVSMLQNPSASERLNGIAYSSNVMAQQPEVQDLVLNVLANDHSTSVRLAAARSLGSMQNVEAISDSLLGIIEREENSLVQINLIQILLENGGISTQQKLLDKLAAGELTPEVQQLLHQSSALNSI